MGETCGLKGCLQPVYDNMQVTFAMLEEHRTILVCQGHYRMFAGDITKGQFSISKRE